MKKRFDTTIYILFFLTLGCIVFSACQVDQVEVQIPLALTEYPTTPTFTPGIQTTSTPILSTPTTTQPGILNFNEDVPVWAQEIILGVPEISESLDTISTLSIDIGFSETPYKIGEIQYFLVTPFETPITSLSLNEFNLIWRSNTQNPAQRPYTILVSEETERVLTNQLGNHQDGIKVSSQPEYAMIKSLFMQSEQFLAIIPAQFLSYDLRTVRVDNQSFFQSEESLSRTLFSVPIYSSAPLLKNPININFSTDSLTTVNITGVTALVRATAVLMRINGNQYPADKILDILLRADYTHISNEVSFSPLCPVQEYTMDDLVFCSPENTFELLEYIDADIIELTGDHLLDYGHEAFLYTLERYKEAGISFYGGGETINAAQQVLKVEHNGNKFAFLGCNAKNPSYAKASDSYPGTWHCDLEKLKQIIVPLQQDGYTPIVTIQHLENNLNTPPEKLTEDFMILSEFRPIILIGTQAHVSKPFKINEHVFIHYGLGNLFFDQINESEAHGEAFIDRLIFYDNHLLNVELFPLLFLDYAQSRPMTQLEERIFLTKIFELSEFTHP